MSTIVLGKTVIDVGRSDFAALPVADCDEKSPDGLSLVRAFYLRSHEWGWRDSNP